MANTDIDTNYLTRGKLKGRGNSYLNLDQGE